MTRSRRLTAAVATVGVLAVAAPAGASAASTITISGATGSAPLVALLAKKYVKLKPGKVRFKLAQGGGDGCRGQDGREAAGTGHAKELPFRLSRPFGPG